MRLKNIQRKKKLKSFKIFRNQKCEFYFTNLKSGSWSHVIFHFFLTWNICYSSNKRNVMVLIWKLCNRVQKHKWSLLCIRILLILQHVMIIKTFLYIIIKFQTTYFLSDKGKDFICWWRKSFFNINVYSRIWNKTFFKKNDFHIYITILEKKERKRNYFGIHI